MPGMPGMPGIASVAHELILTPATGYRQHQQEQDLSCSVQLLQA